VSDTTIVKSQRSQFYLWFRGERTRAHVVLMLRSYCTYLALLFLAGFTASSLHVIIIKNKSTNHLVVFLCHSKMIA
jgi:uncharacterized membrane protein (DUF485 family)